MQSSGDNIFALSSGHRRAGICIFRASGVATGAVLQALTKKQLPEPRRAVLRRLWDQQTLIDRGLVIWMPGPQSFSGEDSFELHCHGSLAIIDILSHTLCKYGLRPADAGEFTRRACMNGRMDLTEAEGLIDLIDAESESQRQQALQQLEGGLRGVYEGWQDLLTEALAMIEGEIDFPDEDGVPAGVALKGASPCLETLGVQMRQAVKDSERTERIRQGLNIALIGAPNVGKSSLINKLAGRDVAITDPEAGTTRDLIEVPVHMAGLKVIFTDMAGLRTPENRVEAEGVRRAWTRSQDSDLRLLVVDGRKACKIPVEDELLALLKEGDGLVFNKMDKVKDRSHLILPEIPDRDIRVFYISALTGQGVEGLWKWLEAGLSVRFDIQSEPGLTQMRHRMCVTRALEAVLRGQENLFIAPELAGDDVRTALQALAELAGTVDMEVIFDEIFSRFCIGK